MVEEIVPVVYEGPVAIGVPPLDTEYQYICSGEFAVSVAVPAEHKLTFDVVGDAGIGIMVATAAERTLLHVPALVST